MSAAVAVPAVTVASRRAADPIGALFHRRHRNAHIWMWVTLFAVAGGAVGGTWYRVQQIRLAIADRVGAAQRHWLVKMLLAKMFNCRAIVSDSYEAVGSLCAGRIVACT